MANFEKMTVDQLVAHNHKLMAQKAAIKAEQDELTAVLDRKVAEQAVQGKIVSMSDVEKAALVQAIKAQGIESGETFGEF